MNELKERFGMTTDTATNGKSAIWLAMMAVFQMPEGTAKSILLGLAMMAMVAVNYFQRGSGLTPEESAEILDTTEDMRDALRRGRE